RLVSLLFFTLRRLLTSPLFPYTTLFRSYVSASFLRFSGFCIKSYNRRRTSRIYAPCVPVPYPAHSASRFHTMGLTALLVAHPLVLRENPRPPLPRHSDICVSAKSLAHLLWFLTAPL